MNKGIKNIENTNKDLEFLKEKARDGSPEDKREVFNFNIDDSDERILMKFKLFVSANYPRYFKDKGCEEHDNLILNYIRSYKGKHNTLELAFRGFAKTTYAKLFITFVLLNDKDEFRKYIKVISKDLGNSKQIVTDIYNLTVEVIDIYGDVFKREGKKKQEETMGEFTMTKGTKLKSGTVGQTQRGHIQDAYRPDWILFEDIEDNESITSATITEKIIKKADEAIAGLSMNGNYAVNGNYISDAGVIEWFKQKKHINVHIVPIAENIEIEQQDRNKVIVSADMTWNRYDRAKLQELFDDSDDFWGEYVCDPERSGDKFFDTERVRKDIQELAKDPERVSGGVRYWGAYKPNHRYGEGMDLSDGVGLDSCGLGLFNFSTGELVVTYDTNEVAPDMFAYEGARVGAEFGNCIIAPEINNSCGGIAVRALKEKDYPNIYQHTITDRVTEKETQRLGWKTDKKSKPDMFYNFRQDYEDGLITIYDERVLKEMKAFTKKDLENKTTGVVTRHFDLLTAVVIAWQMNTSSEPVGTDLSKFGSKPSFK